MAQAPEAEVIDVRSGSALIVAEKLDYARYQANLVLILDVDQSLPDKLTHVGFYLDGAIQPPIPAIVADYPGLLLALSTADQLEQTGRPEDQRAAQLIRTLVSADESLADTARRVLLLSAPDSDPATLVLDRPIQNTKKHRTGRSLAWTVGPSVVRVSSLAHSPETTDELDRFEAGGR